MNKAKSVYRDWEFVSKGTEISLGKFVSEYFTPLTLDLQTGVSTEDTDEIWETAKEEAMEKIKERETRRARADSPMVVETEVEKSFWISRTVVVLSIYCKFFYRIYLVFSPYYI
jgi:hypothetical protein